MTSEELQQIENRPSKFDIPVLAAEIRRLWAARDEVKPVLKAKPTTAAGEQVAIVGGASERAVTKIGKAE